MARVGSMKQKQYDEVTCHLNVIFSVIREISGFRGFTGVSVFRVFLFMFRMEFN
ncbi:unnamed protein product [Onchocerca flexuosa]|uniref:Uncharacterized protein n=1 Tax=Onchocerca flexuosa TaxID=387005 RepID=A0A183I6A1_9BILA|nr:unnamed protein product [Onchocerca flexuosa]